MALTADAPIAASRAASASTPTLGQTLRGLTSLSVARLARWREYRRTLAELQALDDRTLNDMALNRAGLPGVAREAAGYR
ncbi:DUF1127 domain-containing protein [uncultured Albimonas sp.]|uniref:DUF1127 domain-containing protein n=1 Tax=uncultured Albimonas sp. TaxID=1331701 RepID=UPI0030EE8808